jgi:hypothetical protein
MQQSLHVTVARQANRQPASLCTALRNDARTSLLRSWYDVEGAQENREDAMHHTMVPSDRVEHATVYGRDGTKLGTIERLMLDKVRGTVAYAVIKTGGLFGSHHHYPVQWGALRYDPRRQAYATELTLEDLRTGPSEFDGEAFDWGDRSRSYQHPHYWTV